MPRLRSTLVALLLSLAGCAFGTDEQPPVVPATVVPAGATSAVSPEIERWFRGNQPASGTRLMAGDRIAITVQASPSSTSPGTCRPTARSRS